ncbi:Triose-phosphate Transporter [Trapelia coarctata]|nr:Triose-phosphate Transporter [Trapelia coarctata]
MEAAVLEQNHWKSLASSTSNRLPQSTALVDDQDDSSQQHDRAGSSMRKHNTNSSMDAVNSTHNGRRRRSQSTTEKGVLKSQGEAVGSGGSDADEEYKPLTMSQNGYSASTSFGRPTSLKHESDGPSSEEEVTDDEEAGLTKADRGRRRRRKGRHTSLDERVSGSPKISKKERKLADLSVLKSSAINALLIGLWYLFSLSISIYNKWMFSPEHLNFHFPLFTTCMHMLVQFCLASTVLFLIPRFRPRPDSISNPHNLARTTEEREASGPKKPLMTVQFYLSRIAPCGAATGLDIGLGNMSLKFITLTFFTMCKSSALAFVLLFAFIFHLETPSLKLILIIATMTIGVIMMVAGEAAFNALGFALIISSAFFSGFRWALTQILLLRNPATGNPFSSIFFLAPIMFLSLAILAIPIEGFSALREGIAALTAEKGVFSGILLLLFPGVLAFCMTSSEFALLQRTSVVTLSICGIFKEVVTISAAGIVFHDPLTPINVSGLLVTIASIAAYNYIKITKMRTEAREKLKEGEGEAQGMLEDEGERAERRSTSSLVLEAVRSSLTLVSPGGSAGGDGQGRRSPTKRAADLE